jgi:peptide/nickel transport system substrate-binding protein
MIAPEMALPYQDINATVENQNPRESQQIPDQMTPANIALEYSQKNGPYIDELVFQAVGNETDLADALINDEIDLMDYILDTENFSAYGAISEVNATRNGYGVLAFNCERQPFNSTDFRRALAFALDKENLSQYALDGWAQPLDSVIPSNNPFSIEGQLPYSYYQSDIAKASQLLDDAGFAVNGSTGFRMAPNGSAFTVNVTIVSGNVKHIKQGQVIVDTLLALDVNATTEPLPWPGSFVFDVFQDKDYDIALYGWNHEALFDRTDAEWLAEEFWSGNVDVPFVNGPRFSNATFDAWRDQLRNNTDYLQVQEAAQEMQKILAHACPWIISYQNILPYAHRDNRFTGIVSDITDGPPSWWTSYRAHYSDRIDTPYGGTLRWGMDYNISTFNFMREAFDHQTTNGDDWIILGHMYDSLVRISDAGQDLPWLAESWTIETNAENASVPVGRSRITFDLIRNASWNDGTPLTAEDVEFTMQYYYDNSTNFYNQFVSSMTSVSSPSTYRVYIEFDRESYWFLHSVGYLPIIPKHVFQSIGPHGWYDWDPDPRTDLMVTSGPFNITEWVPDDYVKMSYNPNYFFAPDRLWIAQDDDRHYQEKSSPNIVTWSPYADDRTEMECKSHRILGLELIFP